MALPIGNSAYAEENNVIYSNDNSVVYQNEDGSKTALISIPDDVKEGDLLWNYNTDRIKSGWKMKQGRS